MIINWTYSYVPMGTPAHKRVVILFFDFGQQLHEGPSVDKLPASFVEVL